MAASRSGRNRGPRATAETDTAQGRAGARCRRAPRRAPVLLNPAVVSSADVVVIGGGAIGASTAFHLRELGDDVVLVERETLASGSTSKAAGGIRAQFADELNVRIALRSMAELERMDGIAWTGRLPVPARRPGRPRALPRRARAPAAARRPSRELSVDEALEIVPQLEPEGLLGRPSARSTATPRRRPSSSGTRAA